MKSFLLLFTIILLGFIAYLISKLRKYSDAIQKHEKEVTHLRDEKDIVFDFLHDLGEAFTEDLDQRQLLDTILECGVQVTGARGGVIYLNNRRPDQLSAESIRGAFPPPFYLPRDVEEKLADREEYLASILRNETIDISIDNPLSKVFRDQSPLYIVDSDHSDGYPQRTSETLQVRSLIAVPLKNRKTIFGVLALANPIDGHSFTEQEFELAQSIANQASFSLQSAFLYSQLEEKRRLDRDVNAAREIQNILIPNTCPVFPGYDLAALNQPAQRVSGDYYDFLEIDPDHLGIVIADVSGKGLPASLIMAMCRTLIRTQAGNKHSPAEVLRTVNRILYPDIREDMFITMVYLVLDHRHHSLRIAKAGHDAPLLCCNNFEEIKPLQAPGIALGIDSGDVFDTVLQELVVPLHPGDTVLAYTDGVTEAVDHDGQEFGREHIQAALKESAHDGVTPIINRMVDDVKKFRGNEIQNDDITLVALQRK